MAAPDSTFAASPLTSLLPLCRHELAGGSGDERDEEEEEDGVGAERVTRRRKREEEERRFPPGRLRPQAAADGPSVRCSPPPADPQAPAARLFLIRTALPNPPDEDDIRAPIAPTRGRLVDGAPLSGCKSAVSGPSIQPIESFALTYPTLPPSQSPPDLPTTFNQKARTHVFDPFRTFREETDLGDHGDSKKVAGWCRRIVERHPTTSTTTTTTPTQHLLPIPQALSQMFAPPLDLIHTGALEQVPHSSGLGPPTSLPTPPQHAHLPHSFVQACRDASKQGRWLLVNIQKVDEFACQCLNRDVWRDAQVREMLAQHFVLWQRVNDTTDALRYQQYYGLDEFPHLAILDPRTRVLLRASPPFLFFFSLSLFPRTPAACIHSK